MGLSRHDHLAPFEVDGKQLPPPEVDQVLQDDVPGLRLVGGADPDHRHPLRLEEGPQRFLGLHRELRRLGVLLPESGVAVDGDHAAIGVEHEGVDFELREGEARGGREERREGGGQLAEAHLDVHDPGQVLPMSFGQVLLADVGGGHQGPGPLAIQGRQNQVGGREVGGEMLGVAAPLAEGDDRAEGRAFADADQGFVAQILRVVHVLHQEHTLHGLAPLGEALPHLGDRVAHELQVLVHDLDPAGLLLVRHLRREDLEHDPVAAEHRQGAVGDVPLVPHDQIGGSADADDGQDLVDLVFEQLAAALGVGAGQDSLHVPDPGVGAFGIHDLPARRCMFSMIRRITCHTVATEATSTASAGPWTSRRVGPRETISSSGATPLNTPHSRPA